MQHRDFLDKILSRIILKNIDLKYICGKMISNADTNPEIE